MEIHEVTDQVSLDKYWAERGGAPALAGYGGWADYRRTQIAEMRPYEPGEKLDSRVSVSATDRGAGSPKAGDMIARNPKNHDDMWLVAAQYFADNFEPLEQTVAKTGSGTSGIPKESST